MASTVEQTGIFLPIEIVRGILQYLAKSDLKSVRLISQLYSCCAIEFLFDTVYISAFEIDNEVFSAVADHPQISKCIKHLKYDTSRFFPGMSRSSYEFSLCQQLFKFKGLYANTPCHLRDPAVDELLKYPIEDYLSPGDLDDSEDPEIYSHSRTLAVDEAWQRFISSNYVEAGHKKYLQFAPLQESAAGNEQYWVTASSKVKNFASLESVEVYAGWYEYHKNSINCLNYSSFSELRGIGSPLCRSWNPLHLSPEEKVIERRRDPLDGINEFRIFNSFLMAASPRVRHFEMIGTNLPAKVLSAENNACRQLMRENFWPYEQLEVLTLRLSSNRMSSSNSDPLAIAGIPCLLRAASRLKRLKLEIPGYRLFNPTRPLGTIIPLKKMIWHDLQSFTITNVSADALSLMTLLRFGMPNLRDFGMGHVELSRGSWLDVIECMHWYLNLSNLSLRPASFGYPRQVPLWDGHPEVMARLSSSTPSKEEMEKLLNDIKAYIEHGGRPPWKDQDLPGNAVLGESYDLTFSARQLMQQVEKAEFSHQCVGDAAEN